MPAEQQEVIGGKKNIWLHSEANGFDLPHSATPTCLPLYPRVLLETTKARVAVDPAKSALVVLDLQNYFLSLSLGRPVDAVGWKATDKLLQYAIPGCRKVGIQIVWLNWDLTEQHIDEMPPTIVRDFAPNSNFNGDRRIKGLGRTWDLWN